MSGAGRRLYRLARRWGFDARVLRDAIRESPVYRRDRRAFRHSQATQDPDFPEGDPWPVFGDRHAQGGVASGPYFHQDLLVARAVHRRNPVRHVDIGSRIDGFVAHVASFRAIDVVDVRPITAEVAGIRFFQGDLMDLGPQWRGVTDSVSCLHALEHLGLGRYGDQVRADGWHAGLTGLADMLTEGGTLYLSVPTGETQRVEFNAHRVFSLPFLRAVLSERFDIERVAFVDDAGDLHESIDLDGSEARRSFGAMMGCSIWILRKRPG